jgi:repressor LexA
MDTLSERQRRILAFIQEFLDEKGYPPTLREIGEKVQITSTSVVDYNLKALERMGLIRRGREISRGIELVAESARRLRDTVVRVPVLGRIAAGQPLLASENVEETLPLPRSWVRGEEAFLLRVTGESMAPVILPDDLVMVRVQSRVARGEIAVALIDDEATLKRVYEEAGGLVLKGDNPDFTPLRFSPDEAADVKILGKVVGVYRNLEGKRRG